MELGGVGETPSLELDAGVTAVRGAIPKLYRYAVRLTGGDRALAEDLVQEACLALVREVRAVPNARLEIGWLVVVLRRRYLDHLRGMRRERLRLVRGAARSAADLTDLDWGSVDDTVALDALGKLSADQRTALVLRYVDDLPVREVAAMLGRSVAATESLLARGRNQLALLLGGTH